MEEQPSVVINDPDTSLAYVLRHCGGEVTVCRNNQRVTLSPTEVSRLISNSRSDAVSPSKARILRYSATD